MTAELIQNLETITLHMDGSVAVITLNRPDRLNTFIGQMMEDLFVALDWTDREDDVRAVVLTGSGRAFCAGADLSAGADSFDYAALKARGEGGGLGESDDGRDSGGKVTLRIFRSLKPLICAINGDAVGFGATVTLAADLRLAVRSARFGFIFTRRGVVPEGCSTWFLPRIVGISRALDWCLSARFVGAQEAMDAGLVQSCHEPEDLGAAALAVARSLTSGTAPVSVALTRQMMWRMLGASDPTAAHILESAAMLLRGASNDAKEGVASFLDKRLAVFPDRVSTSRDVLCSLPWPTDGFHGEAR